MRYILSLFFILCLPLAAHAENAVLLVPFNGDTGMPRLEHSQAKVDFFPLANHFESQENKLFCGLASSAIVLNTLRLGGDALPQDQEVLAKEERSYLPQGFDPVFKRYTQQNVIKDDVKTELEILGKPKAEKADYGLQLRQLAALLKAHGLDVVVRIVADDLPEETIREELVRNMKTKGDYVLVNYFRPALGQEGSGHISPLGAYDAESDSFLIMDVNPNAAPWVWVKTHDLVQSMRTFDTVENRGYVMVKEKGGQP